MDNPTVYEGCVAVHELFLSLVEAGFTETQALELVKVFLMTTMEQHS